MNEREAREYIRFRLRVKYGSLQAFAQVRGCTPAYITKVILHQRDIPQWLLDEAGLTRVVTYTVTGAQS